MNAALRLFLADSLRWSSAKLPAASQVVAAMLGIAMPICIGTTTGHLGIGMVASIGGLAMGSGATGATFRERLTSVAYTVLAGSAAMYVGAAVAGHGALTGGAIVAIAAVTGLLGSISLAMLRAAMQFVLFAIIATQFGARGAAPFGIMLLFAAGAAWTACVSLLLRFLFSRGPANTAAAAVTPRRSMRQRLRRWWSSLATLAGWQYALRITLCLAVAEATGWVWQPRRTYWVALTVGIVVRRRVPAALTRTFQRAIGTAAGVILGSLFLLSSPPLGSVLVLIALLAAARPVLRAGNYMAYAAIMTPLIILLTELDQTLTSAVLIDRLVATLTGCAIALVFGYLVWPKSMLAAPTVRVRRSPGP